MPTRLIREGILTSDKINELTAEEEVFFRRLLSVADDYGNHDARPQILLGKLYPLKLGQITLDNIENWLAKCASLELIQLYQADGPLLHIHKYGQQHKSRPKYPQPPAQDARRPAIPSAIAAIIATPPSLGKVVQIMGQSHANLPPARLQEAAERYLDSRISSGWLTAKGLPIADWRADCRNFARRYADNLKTAPTRAAANTTNNPSDYA